MPGHSAQLAACGLMAAPLPTCSLQAPLSLGLQRLLFGNFPSATPTPNWTAPTPISMVNHDVSSESPEQTKSIA